MGDRINALWLEKSEYQVQTLARRAGLLSLAFIFLQGIASQGWSESGMLAFWCCTALAYNILVCRRPFGNGPWDIIINLLFAAAITLEGTRFSAVLFQLLLARICLRVSAAKVPRVTLLLAALYLLTAWRAAAADMWRLGYEMLVLSLIGAMACYWRLVLQRNRDNVQKMRELTISNDSIQRKALTDELTGLYNFRAYQEQCGKVGPYALLVLDIDHFKKINDTHGHEFGNKVLVRLGGIIRHSLRKSDLAFRYGGEEFVILLPGADAALATQVAERLRCQIEGCRFSNRGATVPVTVSIGIALNAGGAAEHEVFEQADSALYQAKRSGRNRVELFDAAQDIALVCRL